MTSRISVTVGGGQANYSSLLCSISGDGRAAAFYSGASNLVEGDTNDEWDTFVIGVG